MSFIEEGTVEYVEIDGKKVPVVKLSLIHI